MPTKTKKTTQEKATESYLSSGEYNPKYATEKTVKPETTLAESVKKTTEKEVKPNLQLEKIEKSNNKKIKKKSSKKKIIKKAKITTTKQEIYETPKILLKKQGYELIITEKPQAALKISSSLGNSTKREFVRGVPYYEVDRNGKKIVVACAVGHLFTLTQEKKGTQIPNFEIRWVPNFLVKKGDFTKRYYDTILKLAKNAGSIIVATDYDIEGEVIGTNVVKFICNQNDAKRMKFSTLTKNELENAYEKKEDSLNWGQAIAGETRHFLDWFYGINLSRAIMNAIKSTGKFKIMSIGRVQGPALKLIVEKEKEIQKFKPTTYWQSFITIKNPKLELKYSKDIFDKSELKKFEDLIGKKVICDTKKKEENIPPKPPFNLTSLQTECYNLYGITPVNSLKAAQSLYLSGLISYPRTSSEKLPDTIDYNSILNILKNKYNISHLIKRQKPIEGSKTDPAHPSIYPTGNFQILSGDEEKVYNLIAKRFLALFCEDALIERKKVSAKLGDLIFSTNGFETKKKSWMEFYPIKIKDKEIPDVEGEKEIINSKNEEKQTQPPKRYSPASIISELEKRNLGTKSTRAQILETLYERGYIKEKSIEATPLGISLIETLEKYSPIIIDEKLTKELQDEMDEIVESKEKNLKIKEEHILNKAKKSIIEISKDFEKKEKSIGKELIEALEEKRKIDREENILNECPKCKNNKLRITYSPKNKKFFIACSGYPECKNTYSLPPYGLIKTTGKECEKCGFPTLMALQKGKNPWIFCFNSECETNKERVEAYRKKIEENK